MAVPLPRRVLAARPGDDDRDRRRRHRAVGHQGQGRRAAGLPAPRRAQPRRRAGLRPRQRHGRPVAARRRRPVPRARLHGDPGPGRGAGHRRQLRGAQGQGLRAGRHVAARRAALVHRGVPELRARPPCAAVRERFGFDFHLLHDVHHRLTPIEAARFGKEVEDCRLFWMEDPTPAENQDAFRLIRQHTTTPIAIGEMLSTRSGTSSSSSPSSSSTTCAPPSCTPAGSPT